MRKRRVNKTLQEWRDIKDFQGYQVSNDGKVRSRVNNRHGLGENYHELSQVANHNGYYTVCLGRGNRRLVSRLVAQEFIPNPNNYPMVRHMDDNPKNNNVDNLAWGTQTHNMQDCVKHGRLVGNIWPAINANKKRVHAYHKDGSYYATFNSMTEAAESLGIKGAHISDVAKGKLRQTKGWVFKYADE